MPANKQNLVTILSAAVALALVLSMILYPGIAFEAAVSGLMTWWEVVFPALLPFFIGAQILMGLGVVHAMGVLLEPVMRPLFNVPGCGSFVLAMGLASGYPIGAVLTGDLRRQDMLNKYEAERLVCAANTADPLFMAGAVAVGMFGNESLAGIIMISHYIATLLNGMLLRFYAPQAPISSGADSGDKRAPHIRVFWAVIEARRADGRPLGELLSDAITRSIETMLLIGGFIILFSVVIDVLQVTPVAAAISFVLHWLLSAAGLSDALAAPVTSGIFEITLGCQGAAEAAAPLGDQLTVVSAIIAWSGLSVHAQVAAILNDTDINVVPYMVSRLIHALLAAAITWFVLWFVPHPDIALPAWSQTAAAAVNRGWLATAWEAAGYFLAALALLCVLAAAVAALRPCESG